VKLYGYWRSSASYRVRIALALKGVEYEDAPVNLLEGAQHQDEYRKWNPQGLVPCLVDGDNVIAQSLAIVEYLDERHPQPALLPFGPQERARVRQLALIVACEVAPLQNLGMYQYLQDRLSADEAALADWNQHWIGRGLAAFEALVAGHPATGAFCHGDAPTIADLCLVPQIYNARRRELDLAPYPTLVGIAARCRALPAFQQAAPENQRRGD